MIYPHNNPLGIDLEANMAKRKFSFKEVWNKVIEKEDRPLSPRERIYPSELGWSKIDTYYKMKAVPMTNPANERSRRKFWSGDWEEYMVSWILKCAGLSFTTQDRVLIQFDECYPISGKIDFIITGTTTPMSYDKDATPEFINEMIERLKSLFADGDFQVTILELKSQSIFAFEKTLARGNPHLGHMFQLWCYKAYTGLPTILVYDCRDDKRIEEFTIDNIEDELGEMVLAEAKLITHYAKNDIVPPKEKLITFEDGKFGKNLKVEYSGYLSMLYGRKMEDGTFKNFEIPMEYDKWAKSTVGKWNTCIKTLLKQGLEGAKPLTKTQLNNQAKYLPEMEDMGYDIEEIKKNFKVKEVESAVDEITE